MRDGLFGRDASSVRSRPGPALRPWGWFATWLLVGGTWSFTILAIASVGLLVLPIALAVTGVVARCSHGLGAVGILSGLGLPLFYVAYLNRAGPGNVCTSYAVGQSCSQEWNPWPWLGAAIVFITVGVTVFLLRYRRD